MYEVFNYITGKNIIKVPTKRLARWVAFRSSKWDYERPGQGWLT